jgi:hypothetical protein
MPLIPLLWVGAGLFAAGGALVVFFQHKVNDTVNIALIGFILYILAKQKRII